MTRRLDTGGADPIGAKATRLPVCGEPPASDGRAPRPRSSSRMARRRRIDFLSLRLIQPRAPKDSRKRSVRVSGSVCSVNRTRVVPADPWSRS